jgi:hypothetical protein
MRRGPVADQHLAHTTALSARQPGSRRVGLFAPSDNLLRARWQQWSAGRKPAQVVAALGRLLREGGTAPHRGRITCVAPHVLHTAGAGHDSVPTRPYDRIGCDPLMESTSFLPRSYLPATKIGYHPARGRGPDAQRTLVLLHTVATTCSAHIDARNSSPPYIGRSRACEIGPLASHDPGWWSVREQEHAPSGITPGAVCPRPDCSGLR